MLKTLFGRAFVINFEQILKLIVTFPVEFESFNLISGKSYTNVKSKITIRTAKCPVRKVVHHCKTPFHRSWFYFCSNSVRI